VELSVGAVVYAETFGNPSEAWLYRQVAATGAPLVTHDHRNAATFPYTRAHVVPRTKSLLDRAVAAARLPLARHGYRLPRSTERRLRDALRALSATLLHAHFGPAGLRALPAARALGIPLLVTFHGFDATALPSRDPAYVRALASLWREARRVLCVSGFVASRLRALGCPDARIEVLPMGVPLRPISPREARAVGPVRAATVARLVAQKGVAELVEVVLGLRARGVDLELDVVGDGPERAVVEKRARGAGAVRLHGTLPPDAVARLLEEADLFVLNSRTGPDGAVEGLPVSLLEAMAAGLPVLAPRHGGIPEAVADGETGLLIPEADAGALDSALARLASDPALRAALGAAGRARVERAFDAEKSVARLRELYAG
jgi:colanic acid/amylovoran biosynthesis glycosyltransferase